ncbi:DUF2779 domain-containing protein [Patescibacteria group bacterium]|nr:DUF2779 domain-containing protein [Patescibacteria group bacterium]
MTISKSDYISFLVHPAYLWLKKNEKYKLPPIDEDKQDIFDGGNLFESYVEKLFPDAVKIGFDINDFDTYKSMPTRTQEAIDSGADVILQGRLEKNNITCIFDVLKRVGDNVFDLIEIKGSSSVKPEHSYDLAFQKEVLEGAGLNIKNASVIHYNKDYIRDGEINVEELTIETEVTEDVNSLQEITKEQIKEAFNILDLSECPDLSPRYINQLQVKETKWKDYWMEVFFYIKKDIPEYSIYHLCRLDPTLIATLEDEGIKNIADIPKNIEDLHPKQISQIQTTKSGERIIDKESIKEFISGFEYPLYFFDYETLASVIPLFDGMKPYQHYPFQYSLHILDTPDGEIRHEEYLHIENSNPMPKLIEKMKKDFSDKGTILTWNMSYEIGCNERMAEIYPKHSKFLLKLNERINDLMIPFFNQWFIDKDFFGSASLKAVLPVLIPELSYKNLNISDGLKARRMWTQAILENKNIWNIDDVLKDLSAYCTLDTYSMVKIFEKLSELV